MKYSRKAIEKRYQAGEKMKYLFFWGHRKPASGEVTSSCFSQWWSQDFSIDGTTYPTAEHWMMAEKARLFGDEEALGRILETNSPGNAKQIGRGVRGFDEKVWQGHRGEIVIKGNYHKFCQNPRLKTFLLNTKKRILVEASPVDRVWGIGLDSASDFATVPTRWRGLNLLGFALMEVRDKISDENRF